MIDGIAHYGFMDTDGKLVLAHQFLNVQPFENGFRLKIYGYQCHEVLMDSSGDRSEYL